MTRFLLLLSVPLILASCRLEQRTVPPEELPIGCQVDADCVEGRWCDRGQCELPPAEPDTEGNEGSGGEGGAEGEGEGSDTAEDVPDGGTSDIGNTNTPDTETPNDPDFGGVPG